MKLNYDTILDRANELYAETKYGPDGYFKAPGRSLVIGSDQAKALLRALVEAINAGA